MLLKNLNRTGPIRNLEQKLIKKNKSEGMDFLEAIKKAQAESTAIKNNAKNKILDDAIKETDITSDDYVELIDQKIKIIEPEYYDDIKRWSNDRPDLADKTRALFYPDWAEVKYGENYAGVLQDRQAKAIRENIDPNFKEPLSPSDQMVSDIDDMNTANLDELLEGRKKNAQGGMQQLVQPSGDGSRPGYNIGKLVTETKNQLKKEIPPLRKYQLNERLKFLEQTKLKAKNIKGSKSIENLILKKDKTGRPFFSEYLEKLNALKDIQDNKYKNPKTKKPFTPKEWLDASATTRSKYRNPEVFLQKKKEYQKNYMAEKKKDPEYKKEFLTKKKDEYYSTQRKKPTFTSKDKGRGVLLEQRNRLLSYMSMASKDNPNYKEIIKDGKFLGVTDKSTGVNYYEAGYKGKLGKNSKLITNHPDFKNVNNLAKLADKYKRALPNKAISSYFNAYERVPKLYELQNFLQADPRYVDKMSSQYFKTNPLHLHHQISVTESPSKKLQLLLQDKNDQAGKKMMEYKKGNITEKKLNTELKKLNARYVVDGKELGAIETSPETQLKTAKTQTTKLFNKTLKANPKLVEDITQQLGILGCPKGLQAASGGRIKFSKGTTCAIKGRKILEEGLKNGFKKSDVGLAQKILGSGKFLKDAVSLRGLFGPAALAFTVAAEAGLVGFDMLASGKSFKEAVGSSLFNYMLGDKTKIDSVEERDKRMVAEGMTPEQMGKIKYMESMMGDMQQGFDLDNQLNAIKENRKQIGNNSEDTFNEGAFQLDLDKQEDKLREEIQDYNRVNKVGELENYFTPKEDGTIPFLGGMQTLTEGLRRNELAQLQSVNNPLEGPISQKKRSAKIRELMLQNPDVRNYMGSYPTNYGFMEGGIASLNVNKK